MKIRISYVSNNQYGKKCMDKNNNGAFYSNMIRVKDIKVNYFIRDLEDSRGLVLLIGTAYNLRDFRPSCR